MDNLPLASIMATRSVRRQFAEPHANRLAVEAEPTSRRPVSRTGVTRVRAGLAAGLHRIASAVEPQPQCRVAAR